MIFPALALAIGERRATALSIAGRVFDAVEAHEYGLVTELSDNPLERAKARAEEAASYSANAMCLGLAYSRRIRSMSWEEAGEEGRRTRAELMAHPDFAKGVKSFFSRLSS
jgi:enoyl-CoA hydratase/carnithine racemase